MTSLYSGLSIKRTGYNKRTGGKIILKQLSEQDVISEKGGGNSLKQLSKQDVLSKQKQEKQQKTLVQSNRYMVPSVNTLFTHNIYLKIKELWLKRWKRVI